MAKLDPEVSAMLRIVAILAKLDPKARERVLRYVLAKLAEGDREYARVRVVDPEQSAACGGDED